VQLSYLIEYFLILTKKNVYKLSFLNPKNVKNITSVEPAAQYFETSLGIHLYDIYREWQQLRNVYLILT